MPDVDCSILHRQRASFLLLLDAKDETVIYFFLPLIYSQGSSVLDEDGETADGFLNGDATKNVFNWIKEMVVNGYVSATPAGQKGLYSALLLL